MARTPPSAPILAGAMFLLLAAQPAFAVTARDVSDRMRIDGFPGEWQADERVFGVNGAGQAEESATDSRWGPNNDLNQISVTWDKDHLYFSAEGLIWGNNVIVLFDVVPDRGLPSMSALTSWSRLFAFSDDFRPDLFGATWDGNARPRLLIHRGGTQINDQQPGDLFDAYATFAQDQAGRAMEFAIPWNTLFLGSEGLGTRDTALNVGGVTDTFHVFPAGAKLRLAGVITAGGDNTGGPDSAPDNTQGHSDNSSIQVVVDNFAIIDLDRRDDTGLGGGGPDGIADWGVDVKGRVTFKIQPPITALRFTLSDVQLNRTAFAPDQGDSLRFRIRLGQTLDPANPADQARNIQVSAKVYDVKGRFVRDLYLESAGQSTLTRPALATNDPALDWWDGRDAEGRPVAAGIYVLRVVLEPGVNRLTRAFVVVK